MSRALAETTIAAQQLRLQELAAADVAVHTVSPRSRLPEVAAGTTQLARRVTQLEQRLAEQAQAHRTELRDLSWYESCSVILLSGVG